LNETLSTQSQRERAGLSSYTQLKTKTSLITILWTRTCRRLTILIL